MKFRFWTCLLELAASVSNLPREAQKISFLLIKIMAVPNSLKKQLPAELGQHCTAINRQGQTLVISVDAAVWATKLRFLTRQLTRATGASQVRIRVSTPQSVTQRPAKKAAPQPRRSSTAVATLDHAARHQPDEQIRQALQRLADAIKREPLPAGRKR